MRVGFVELNLNEIVSFAVTNNIRSTRVMEKLGMHRDIHDDFDHPGLALHHPLRRHVLYRLRCALNECDNNSSRRSSIHA